MTKRTTTRVQSGPTVLREERKAPRPEAANPLATKPATTPTGSKPGSTGGKPPGK